MSLYALTSAGLQGLARNNWGVKIQAPDGGWTDTGVQDVVDQLLSAFMSTAAIPLSAPLELQAPSQGGPSIIIHRTVPVIGDNSTGDSFNLETNTGVIRFIDQNGNITDVPGGNSNVTNVGGSSSGGGSGTGATGSITYVTDVSATLTIDVSVSGCSVTCTPTLTITLTKKTSSFVDGLWQGES